MKSDEVYQKKYDTAINSMGKKDPKFNGFEQRVWAEIALRNESGWKSFKVFQCFRISVSTPIAVLIALLAIAVGAFFGVSRGNAYDREVSMALEKRYIQTIHPIMRSKNHSLHAPR